ncbi:hypothetical protein BuS5_01225 [Desulfosarcina sp. BuS5]|uniref:glycosyltransferase n=1 Tax=Desulfosarcina sp. BuS5 TaxID=933262 RepID=UPI000688E987|nr:glycosyltransferase [Desulfosarcina sp. BuS5]WDN88257.1 hypothetical protein BuS5_01225 [Desulfosarcina sp. BuS5]
MKIIHLLWGLNTGGSETMLVDIVNEQSLTAEVVVLIGNADLDHTVLERINPRVEVKLLGRPPGSRNPWYIFKLYRMLKVLNPDIVHSHLQSFIRILRLLKIPKVLTAHHTGIQISTVSSYDAIYSISTAVKIDLSERYPEITTTTIPNGIVCSNVVQKSCYDQHPFRIVQIGRLAHEIKGQDVLLKALQHVNNAIGDNDITLDFIGNGPSKKYLAGLAEELGVNEWCRFLGHRSRSYVYKNLHNYDLLVQPSRFEGFGLTVVEAMAALVPVLVSDIEGPMEIIDKGNFGYFFRTENYEDCANQIVNIKRLSKEQEFIENRKKTAEYAMGRFDIKLTAARYLDEYRKVIHLKKD